MADKEQATADKVQENLFNFFNKFSEKDYITIKERKTKKEYDICTELPAGISFYMADNIDEISQILSDIQTAYKNKNISLEKAATKVVRKTVLGKGLNFVFNLLAEILMNDYEFMNAEWCKHNLGLRYAVELVFTFAAEVVATFNDLGGQDLIGQAVATEGSA
jgi:hypothetical protein